MWPTRAGGTSSSTASSMPRPARRTGTTTTSAPIRNPEAGPIGVSTVVATVATSRSASAASRTLIRVAARRNCSGGVVLFRSDRSASCTSGWSTRWTGTRLTLYLKAFGLLFAGRYRRARVEVLRAAKLRAVNRGLKLGARITAIALALAAFAACGSGRGAASLVVVGGTVITEDAARRVLSPGAVAINGTDIIDVDRPEVIARRYQAADTIEARDQIVLPGLINTHTHAPMVMYRGLADDLALMDWLQKYIFPAEAKTVSPEFVRIGTRLAALEMIESGTTTFADMYYFEEDIARATRDAGLRGVLGETIIQFPVADAKTPAEGLARAEAFIKAFRNDRLIVPAVAPHSMYTLDRESLIAAAALARKYDAPLIIHLAETEDEVKIAREQHNATPAGYLESIGFWGPRTPAPHGG